MKPKPIKKPINGRAKGHAFETQFCKYLRHLGFEAITSRSESKRLDDAGVDIVDNSPFYFQLKAVEKLKGWYGDIIDRMPIKEGKTRVVVHKKNNKGSVVVMRLTDFESLLLNRWKEDVDFMGLNEQQ